MYCTYLVGFRSQKGSAAKAAKGIDTHTHPLSCQLNPCRDKVYLVHPPTSDLGVTRWAVSLVARNFYYINSKQGLHTSTTQRTLLISPSPQPSTSKTHNFQFSTSSSPIQSTCRANLHPPAMFFSTSSPSSCPHSRSFSRPVATPTSSSTSP